MSLPQREHPEAATELDEAVDSVEARESDLGASLIESATAARQRIGEWPDAWPPFPGWNREPLVRSKGLDVFPYRLVHCLGSDELIIPAYAHEGRRCGY